MEREIATISRITNQHTRKTSIQARALRLQSSVDLHWIAGGLDDEPPY
ncbi:hypothetical protein LLG95_16315 [bacterium]|nr:hypothetical protein [bacterium]